MEGCVWSVGVVGGGGVCSVRVEWCVVLGWSASTGPD